MQNSRDNIIDQNVQGSQASNVSENRNDSHFSRPANEQNVSNIQTDTISQGPAHRRRQRRRKRGKATAVLGGDADDELLCVVCAGTMEYYAVGECDHPVVCSICCLRSRTLMKNRSCPICKTEQENVLVALLEEGNAPQLYSSFSVWGDTAGPSSELDPDSGILFINCKAHFDALLRLKNFYCTVKGCRESELCSKAECMEHIRTKHSKYYCSICLNDRPLFPSEQELFTTAGLKKHEQGLFGHPLCSFCKTRFFDGAHLYRHMNSAHITCHLCPEDRANRYYRDADQLRTHLQNSHFICDISPCDGGASSAFATTHEYRTHLVQYHNIRDSNAQARSMLGFNVRRASNRYNSSSVTETNQSLESFEVAPPVQITNERETRSRTENSGRGWAGAVAQQDRSFLSNRTDVFPSLPQPSRPIPGPSISNMSLVRKSWATRARNDQGDSVHSLGNHVRTGISAAEDARAQRNVRLASALGIATPVSNEAEAHARLHNVQWSDELLSWARERFLEVDRIEKQIAKLLDDPKGTSIALKPMPRERRKLAHELAEACGLSAIAYDAEPKRYLSIIKTPSAFIPSLLLTKAARDSKYKRLEENEVPRKISELENTTTLNEEYLEIYDVQSRISSDAIVSTLKGILGIESVVSKYVSWIETDSEKYGTVQLASPVTVKLVVEILEKYGDEVFGGENNLFRVRPLYQRNSAISNAANSHNYSAEGSISQSQQNARYPNSVFAGRLIKDEIQETKQQTSRKEIKKSEGKNLKNNRNRNIPGLSEPSGTYKHAFHLLADSDEDDEVPSQLLNDLKIDDSASKSVIPEDWEDMNGTDEKASGVKQPQYSDSWDDDPIDTSKESAGLMEPGGWICQACTLHNKSYDSCVACGLSKG